MIPYIVTKNNATIYNNGKPITVPRTHPHFNTIIEAVQNGDIESVLGLLNVAESVAALSNNRFEIVDRKVCYQGKPIHDAISTRILDCLDNGIATDNITEFYERLEENPDKRAVEELFLFLEASDLPITPDGHFLAYKKVRDDYTDIYTGTFDNSVGQIMPRMKRADIDTNRHNTCSRGFHVCSHSYLNHFGSWSRDDRVMVCKVNPADVVTVPSDYNNAKMRVTTYEVVDEIEDYSKPSIEPNFTQEYGKQQELDLEDTTNSTDSGDSLSGQPSTVESTPKFSNAKLDDLKVAEVLNCYADGWTDNAICATFDISRRQAKRIYNGEAWKHVTRPKGLPKVK